MSGKGLTGMAAGQYHNHLHQYLRRRLQCSSLEPDDVMQEAYLRLLRVEDASLIRHPQAYLFKIVANVVREMELREQKSPLNSHDDLVDPDSVPAAAGSDIDRLEHQSSMMAVLRRLPARQQAVLLMHKRDGKTYREIAAELNLTLNTVKKYLFQALSNCRKQGWK